MTDIENRIIEFLDGDTVKFGLVTKAQGKKLLIDDENGRQSKVSEKQVLFAHQASTKNDFKPAVESLKSAVSELCEEVDTGLIWTELSAETEMDPPAIADLYFSNTSALHCSAIFQALRKDSARFRFKNGLFSARTEEEIAQETALRERKEAAENRLRDVRAFIKRVHQASAILPIPDSLTEWLAELEQAFQSSVSNDALAVLSELKYDQAPERLAFDVLVKTGRLSPGSDDILKLTGLTREFPDALVDCADALSPFEEDGDREDFREQFTFSIDDDDTQEVDDAISIERLDDRVVIGVHIADVAHFVSRDDALDQEAARRCATLYMPTGPVMMLPERVSCDLASLNLGETRPAFSTVMEMDYAGKLLDYRISRSVVSVDRRFNYEEADLLLAMGTDSVADDLQLIAKLMDGYMEKRLKAGSIIFSKLEQKIRVTDDEVDGRAFQTDTPSRNLIAELMIQSNALTAEFARENDIPLIFRAQVPPDQPAARYRGQVVKDTNPNVFRGLKRGRLSLTPQEHAGLGLDTYTQVSSPLRRFGDLVMQRQLTAFLEGRDDYPYTAIELMEVIGNAEAVERENRELERISTRYWELEYVRRQGKDVFPAVVMSKVPGGYIVGLRPVPVRGKMNAGNSQFRFGQTISVRVDKLIPELSVFKVKHEAKS